MNDLLICRIEGKGRGVFAGKAFKKNDVLERSPVIILPIEEVTDLSVLDSYSFDWDRGHAVVLGYGSLYNHSDTPNMRMEKIYNELEVIFIALRDIKEGEELTYQYGGGKYDVIFNGDRYFYSLKTDV